jgi:hypothetical protein
MNSFTHSGLVRGRGYGFAAENEWCRQQRSKSIVAAASRQKSVEEELRLSIQPRRH